MKKVSKISIKIIMTILLNLCFTVTVKAADSYDDVIKGFQEVAYAYYMRGPRIQYNSTIGDHHVFTPEDATTQKNCFSHCTFYFYNIYNELLGITISYGEFWNTTDYYKESVKNGKIYNFKKEVEAKAIDNTKPISAKEIVAYGENNTEKTKVTMYFNDGTIDDTPSVEEIVPYLRPGDVLIYTGHVILVYDLKKDEFGNVTDAYVIHSMHGIGGGHTFSRIGRVVKGIDNNKIVGELNHYLYQTTRQYSVNKTEPAKLINDGEEFFEGSINIRLFKNYSYWADISNPEKASDNFLILRFIDKDDSNNAVFNYKPVNHPERSYEKEIELSDKNLFRLNHSRIYIEKTVDAYDNDTVIADDELTYTITVKNNSNEDYKDNIIVTEELSPYVTLIDNGNGTVSENKITWDLGKLQSKTEITKTYKVKVKSEYDGKTTENKAIISKGMVGDIPNRTVKNKIGKVLNPEEESQIVSKYNELKEGNISGKTLINEIYRQALGIDLKLNNFELEDLIIVEDRADTSASAMWLNTNNPLYSSILNNYWSSICVEPNKDGTGIDFYDLRRYRKYTIRRADRIYSENFRTGDILIYNNSNDVTYSVNENGELITTPVTNENGEYAYIYIAGEGFVGVNLGADQELGTIDDRNEFNHEYYSSNYLKLYSKNLNPDSDETISILEDSNYQTLLAKDYYVILRPSLSTYTTENYSVGNEKYDTLYDAYNAITGNSGTIRILKDNIDHSDLTIEEEKNITIDTNGKTITKTGASIKNLGTLTIKGNGSICISDIPEIPYLIVNEGTLNIDENVKLTHMGNSSSSWFVIYSTAGTVNVKRRKNRSKTNSRDRNNTKWLWNRSVQ